MSKVNTLLTQRLKSATEKLSKMTSLSVRSSSGELSSFSGVFRVTPLTESEKEKVKSILLSYKELEDQEIENDFSALIDVTSELKAINNQAAILHGERIKKAQEILKKYRDGAFTAWLIATYGNRQTPYNFLQFYELYRSLPHMLLPKLEEMPRQALYALASRSGPLEKKEEIIKNYRGEPKQELLSQIRLAFPLAKEDKRAHNLADVVLTHLKRLNKLCKDPLFKPSQQQKRELLQALSALSSTVE